MQSLAENIINIVPKMMVSDEQLTQRLRELLKIEDLSKTTNSTVRRKLEDDFGIDLSNKKVFIREQVDIFLQNQYEEDCEYSDDEDEVDNSVEVDGIRYKVVVDYADAEIDQLRGRPDELINYGKKRRCGVNKICSISPQLQELVGVSELARTKVIEKVWAYIREKNLQDPKNIRTIRCDNLLRSLFGVDSINLFFLNKALSKHLCTLDSDDGEIVKKMPKKKQQKLNKKDTKGSKQKEKVQKLTGKTGFIAPYPISDALMSFTGKSQLSRADAVKRIWDYIKAHNLQDPSNKRMVICDEKLRELLGVETFQGFFVSNLLARHFLKTEQY